jgi:hypothetical protein
MTNPPPSPAAGRPYKVTGGAHVGWVNATWPLAKLTVNSDELSISAVALGTYRLAPNQVSSIEKYVMIPVIGWGIRIRHVRADYPQRLIFWCFGNPHTVLQGIRNAGFLPAASGLASSERRGMPIRWSAVVVAILIWNALFLLDSHGRSDHVSQHPSPLILAPLVFIFAVSLGTIKLPALQRIVLKPGRSVGEIRPLLGLLALVSFMLLVVFTILLFTGALTASGSFSGSLYGAPK